MVITGARFVANPSVYLVDGGETLVASTYVSSTALSAVIPAWFMADYYGVKVVNPDLQWDTLTNAFTLTNPVPLIAAVTPDNGPEDADTPVTITGANFVSGLSVSMEGYALLSLTFVNSTTLTGVVPVSSSVMPGGPYTVTVANPGPLAPSDSMSGAFTVTVTQNPTTTCDLTPNCGDAYGDPDGTTAEISEGGVLTYTFPAGTGVRDGAGYDFVFYEWANPPGILLDWVIVEISQDGAGWCRVFDWGDGLPDNNTNVAAYTAGGETDNEPIASSDLWPKPDYSPPNTGVAIDISVCSPPPSGQYPYVRFLSPFGGNGDAAQIDALVRLH
jgi:hypothetical protein